MDIRDRRYNNYYDFDEVTKSAVVGNFDAAVFNINFRFYVFSLLRKPFLSILLVLIKENIMEVCSLNH